MNDHISDPSAPPPQRNTSGAGKILAGFVMGALVAMAPMYYLYTGREAALRQSGAEEPPAPDARTGAASESSRGFQHGGKLFASRLTYELSQVPQEPVATVARATAPVPAAASSVAAPGPRSSEESASTRVADARPISASPPPPRDRTPSIEQETQKPEYRAAAATIAAAPQPRVIEGRDVELKPKLPDTPTRPIVAAASTNMRAEIEAERSRLAAEVARAWPQSGNADAAAKKDGRITIATAPAATPIGKAADTSVRAQGETVASAAPAPASAGAQPAGSVEGRLLATRDWLASAPQTTHTIQLMGSGSTEQLTRQLSALSKVLEPGKIYVFRTLAQGKPSLTVVYGSYVDRQAALQALEKLPASITANRPVLRTVNGIRAEMKQNKTDS